MMQSMTAYARAETTANEMVVLTEIRSYNHRHLDIALRLPNVYIELENRIKALISDRIKRGRVEIKVQIRDDSESAVSFEIHPSKATSYNQVLSRLKDEFNITPQYTFGFLVDSGVIVPRETERDMEVCWTVIKDCISQALDGLIEMRKKEGQFIAQDIYNRLDTIQKNIALIDEASNGLLERYQQRLKERIADLTKGIVALDPARISQEAAFLADRSDISEEIVRALSHVKQFRHVMESDGPSGQKLNFLVQELHRESNTMGSKTDTAVVSHYIVDVKSELEKIREQVQNIE